MKKLLALFLCSVMLFSIAACDSKDNDKPKAQSTEAQTTAATDSKPDKSKVEFYAGTTIPTVDSVLDVKNVSDDGNFIYGTFDSEEYLKMGMIEYVMFLEDNYGYTYEMNSSSSSALNVHTDDGIMIVMGSFLTDTGYVLGVGLPD